MNGLDNVNLILNTGEGYLAYGTSDGSIGLVRITQILLEEDNFSFVPKYNVKLDLDHHHSQMVYDSQNLAGTTAMRWINIAGRNVCSVSSSFATEWMDAYLIL